MNNPWEEISLQDYESHMSLDSVKQLQAMNAIMKKQFGEYPVKTAMVLGVAGGNGLEHVDPEKFSKVFGIDINEEYLKAVSERYSELGDTLQCERIDLIEEAEKLPCTELLIANLLIEYIGYSAFQKAVKKVSPQYVSCVIQINTDTKNWVSDSPYLHAFDGLDTVHHQMEETALTEAMKEIGYSLILKDVKDLPNGKALVRLDFERGDALADLKKDSRKMRAVFTDLDGTVLRKDKSISDRTMEAIRAFRKNGGIWAVASARPERAISAMYKEFTEADALITLNGARIKLGDRIISNGFSKENARSLLSKIVRHDDLIVVLETSEGIFGNIEIPEWDTPAVSDLVSLLDTCDLYKILLAGKEHQLDTVKVPQEGLCDTSSIPDRIKEAIRKEGLEESAYFTVAEGWLYQIMSTSAKKWNGVQLVLEKEGIDKSEAMYFGDDHDDVESISNIGLGIAMGNAIEEVKKVADQVTATNEEDGVARIVEKYIL
ncbi:MAG: HAD hydrolase family protein [Clostridiales bacterium]|nr:HAD hydrolase family protein [Clostridiales bacterium]